MNKNFHHLLTGISFLPALLVMPVMADTLSVIDSAMSLSSGTIYDVGSITVNGLDRGATPATYGVIDNNGTLNLTGTTMSNNTGRYGLIDNMGTLNASGVNVVGNNALAGGFVYNEDTTTITNSTFNGNVASASGGVVYNTGSTATITGSTFSGNTVASGSGGAITNVDSALSINNSVFTGNESSVYGGAILTQGTSSTLSINGSSFYENKSDVGGVLAELLHSGQTTITNSSFYNNEANEIGALYLLSATALIEDTDFTSNQSKNTESSIMYDGGGAVWIGSESTTNMNRVVFNNNQSGTDGGAIASRRFNRGNNVASTLDISNATFVNNTAGRAGGALDNYLYNDANNDGYVKITNASFTSNSAETGGAIYNHKATIGDKLKTTGNQTAESNASDIQVGNIYITDAGFVGNTASTQGGAIYNEGIITLAAANKDVVFNNNTANGVANDIYNKGTVNLTAANGKNIYLNGGIDGLAGTVNVNGAGLVQTAGLKNQTANISNGEFWLSNGANVSGSTVAVTNGATINTIDDAINDYSSVITLAHGTNVKADALLGLSGQIDKFNIASGDTVTLAGVKVLQDYDGTSTLNLADYGNIIASGDVYTSVGRYTLAGQTSDNGQLTITKMGAGGLYAATTSTTDGTRENVSYSVTADDTTVSSAAEIKNADMTITGQGTNETDDSITLAQNLTVGDTSTLSIENAKFIDNGGSLINTEYATLNIKDSLMNVAINNSGTLISDPTYYTAQVVNSGTAVFDGDIFESTSSLNNSSTVNLSDTTFMAGSVITNTGTINLTGGTTTFNNNVDNLDLVGAGGNLNVQNNKIDSLGVLTANNNVGVSVDADLRSGASDKFSSVTGSAGVVVDSISLAESNYNDTGAVKRVAVLGDGETDYTGKLSVSNALDVHSAGTNYFTKVTADDNGNIVFSDKLMNTSGMHKQLGDWSNGNYIAASTVYDSDTESYSTTSGQTVGAALTALDYAVKENADNFASLATANTGDLVDGSNIKAGTITMAKLDSAIQTALGQAGTALQSSALQNTELTGNTQAENLAVSGNMTVDGNAVLTTANVTSSITENGTGVITSGAVYNGLAAKQDVIDNNNKLNANLVDGLASVATTGKASDLNNDVGYQTESDVNTLIEEATTSNNGVIATAVATATTMNTDANTPVFNNFADGTSVTQAVATLDSHIGTVHGLVDSADATKTTNNRNYSGNLAVGTTVEDHLLSLDDAIGDMRNFDTQNTYATDTNSVAMNLRYLDTAITTNSALALSQANAYTDRRVEHLDKELSAGVASAVALTAVASSGVEKGEVAVSGGYGYYNGQSAAAFGAAMGLSNRWSVNAGAGISNADVSFRAGTTYKFKVF